MKRILFAPDSPAGGAPASPAQPTPAAAPAAKPAEAAPASAPVPAASEPDPFEAPKKVVPAAAPKPGDKPATHAAIDALDEVEKLAPKELRARVKQLRDENKSYPSKIKALEDKIRDFESRGQDTSALTTRMTAIEKERDAAMAELRAARQEASPEFKEKYDKPFNQSAERARKQIVELTVSETDPESGAVTSRPATWNDFAALYSLPVGKAIEQANALFGNSANFVLGLREKLLDLDVARQQALEEEKSQFKERSAKEIAEQAKAREGVGKLWQETNERLALSVDDYKDDPTDTEAVEARKHALSVFDAPIESSDREDFVKKKVLKDAHIRQRVGAYAVQKVINAKLREEINTLKSQLGELKESEPGKVRRAATGATGKENEDSDEGFLRGAKEAVGA